MAEEKTQGGLQASNLASSLEWSRAELALDLVNVTRLATVAHTFSPRRQRQVNL